eukprot:CAMPEP_0196589072 /NCGR_PEP_ID=MMETSP1081-20130531/62623_1 /TAXON_ID=36882 /ORGANISM="Pyramimonas amylifera, Strain CCMP720" /LENGTH=157 /DNA_ID=CAMNT_0041911785 /DNA_START=15 /DNA_END=485 /DNA_ORIENTATION=-
MVEVSLCDVEAALDIDDDMFSPAIEAKLQLPALKESKNNNLEETLDDLPPASVGAPAPGSTFVGSGDDERVSNAAPPLAARSMYYYAHTKMSSAPKRAAGSEPGEGPGWVLDRTSVSTTSPVVTIEKYMFSDEGQTVKVMLPLEGADARVSKDDVFW